MIKTDDTINKIIEAVKNGEDPDKIKDIINGISKTTIKDRVKWIAGTPTIGEVRRRLKIAHAKKSKSKNNPKSRKKYEEEIKAGNNQLNKLLAEAGEDLKKLVKLEEEPHRILTKFVEAKETEIRKILETFELSAKNIKESMLKMPTETFSFVEHEVKGLMGEEGLEIFKEKALRKDQRIMNMNRRLHLILFLEKKREEEKNAEVPEQPQT